MGIATLLFGRYLGTRSIGPETAGEFLQASRSAFILFSVLCACGVAASLVRRSVRRP
jgi:hypothetical protein